MLSVLLLSWTVLTLHTTATCYHLQRTSSPSAANAPDPKTRQYLEAKTWYIRRKGSERAQKLVRQGSEGDFSYWKDRYKSCFSAINLKSHAFLCLDAKGKLYTSVFNIMEDCWFRRVTRYKHYDVFHSSRGDVLLINHRQVRIYFHDFLKVPGFVFSKRHKNRTYHRKRRSWNTDPADPLGSEYPHLSTMSSSKSDPEPGGNISKETITSVDDPLEVLLSHSARSPTLEKHKKNRKARF